MFLSSVIREYHDEMVCDLAETYHITDHRSLSVLKLATLVMGLRDDSRVKLAISGQTIRLETLLMAGAFDNLRLLLWSKTKDGAKGNNRPSSVLSSLIDNKGDNHDNLGFNSAEEFEKARNQMIKTDREEE